MSQCEALFKTVIEQLKADHRPMLTLDEEQLVSLSNDWRHALLSADTQALTQVLCILDHTLSLSELFNDLILDSFRSIQAPETLIYVLSVSQKHVIDRCGRKGERVPHQFVMALKDLLNHDDPELLEWTLRTIDQLGQQSLLLKEDVLGRKPGILAIFNKHKNNSRMIIEMLEKRWSSYGG